MSISDDEVSALLDLARAVIALGIDYPDGHVIEPHQHRRGQLVYGSTGVVWPRHHKVPG